MKKLTKKATTMITTMKLSTKIMAERKAVGVMAAMATAAIMTRMMNL